MKINTPALFLFAIVFMGTAGCGAPEDPAPVAQKKGPSQNASRGPSAKPATDHYQQALRFLEEGQVPRAMASLRMATQRNPNDPRAYFLLGRIFMNMKQYEEASRYFLATVQLQPDNGQAFFLLAGCYDLLGRKDEAINSVQRSLTIFQEKKDEDNFRRALAVLQALRNQPPSDGG